MKRIPIVLLSLLIVGTGTAQAVPGPDPEDEHPTFDIQINIVGDPTKDITSFEEAASWDFGDRSAYRCAWVEFFQAGSELFEVSYRAVSDYSDGTIQINDSHGLEAPDSSIGAECWGNGDQRNFVADGSDHFPHSTSLVFRDEATGIEIGRIDYPTQCKQFYWTPGNQAGEAWLWWDADGPADMMKHGDGLCGGGHQEPTALVQAKVRALAPGIEACTTDPMHGDMCTTSPEPDIASHPTKVTFRLSGRIRATGFVRVPDGTAPCKQDRVVVVQRRSPAESWKRVGSDRTSAIGRYSEHIRDRAGVYRVKALKTTLETGDICKADISRTRSFLSNNSDIRATSRLGERATSARRFLGCGLLLCEVIDALRSA